MQSVKSVTVISFFFIYLTLSSEILIWEYFNDPNLILQGEGDWLLLSISHIICCSINQSPVINYGNGSCSKIWKLKVFHLVICQQLSHHQLDKSSILSSTNCQESLICWILSIQLLLCKRVRDRGVTKHFNSTNLIPENIGTG